jgi:hypothetical protein
MFGMSDPNQTLAQMIRYFEEERYEMVEVMASEFTSMLLANKQRDGATQALLVKGVRILAEVLSIRSKSKLAIQATSVLLRERKKLEKILSQTAPNLLSKLTPIEQDYRIIGSVFAKAGKASKAKKFYLRAHKEAQGNIAALVAACQVDGGKTKLCKTLASAVQAAGPVILENGAYHLKPEHAPGSQIDPVLAVLETCSHGHTECAEQGQRIRKECDEIANGIQAANERLQSAMDSLQPKHDYYQYS